MSWDDDQPTGARAIALGEKLDRLSVDELDERIAVLRAEIARVEAELREKKAHAAAAAALFKP